MLDNKKYTGNKTDTPDFLKVLLTLKKNIMRDLNVAEVCKVLEVNNNIYTVVSINNSNLRLRCTKLSSLNPKKDDLVLVVFTNTDYRLNLSKTNKPFQNLPEETLHSLNYGIIIGFVSNSGSIDVGTKVTVGGIFQPTYEMNKKANVSDIPTKTSQLINDSGYITSILVDSVLSTTSENPVQNKIVTNAINNLETVKADISKVGSKTLLWSGSYGTNEGIVYTDTNISNYDFLLCTGEAWNNNNWCMLVPLPKTTIGYGDTNRYFCNQHNSGTSSSSVKGTSYYVVVEYNSVNGQVKFRTGYDNTASSNQGYLTNIYGIKFGGYGEN